MMQVTAVHDVPPLQRPETAALAAAETARMVDLLRSLDSADWAKPTECPGWDVRAMAGHVLGMVETFGSFARFGRDMVAGWRASRAAGGPLIDGLTSVQVRDHAALDRDGLVERLAAMGPRQARWRAERRLLRYVPIGHTPPGGAPETWKAGYLLDLVLTRDTWMHRVDITRATGRELVLTREHDGRLVADVVAEWARRHGRPFVLHLDGPAGGTYSGGTGGEGGEGGEEIRIDAVDFCRILSGRAASGPDAQAAGLLAVPVPF